MGLPEVFRNFIMPLKPGEGGFRKKGKKHSASSEHRFLDIVQDMGGHVKDCTPPILELSKV